MLIFAIAIGCSVLADIPASSLQFPSCHSSLSGPFLPLGCPALRGPRNARGVLGCTLRFRPRVNPRFLCPLSRILFGSPCLSATCCVFTSDLAKFSLFSFATIGCLVLGDCPPSISRL